MFIGCPIRLFVCLIRYCYHDNFDKTDGEYLVARTDDMIRF